MCHKKKETEKKENHVYRRKNGEAKTKNKKRKDMSSVTHTQTIDCLSQMFLLSIWTKKFEFYI
jgi:hypothetical protein